MEGAIAALRMIENRRWHGRLLKGGELRDDDVLTLVGLECMLSDDARLTTAVLKEVFAAQRRRLEARRRPTRDTLGCNIQRLASLLKLNPTECAILRLSVAMTRIGEFRYLFRLALPSADESQRAVCDATGMPMRSVQQQALSDSRTLRRGGFLELGSPQENPLELASSLVDALLSPRFDEVAFLRRLIRHAPPATLERSDFMHVPEVELMLAYLRDALARRKGGVNVLVHGAPGTGKTECARMLAVVLRAELHEVPNVDRDGDPISGRRRFSAYLEQQQSVDLVLHQTCGRRVFVCSEDHRRPDPCRIRR
jgi:hypothetical protein